MNDDLDTIQRVMAADVESFRLLVERCPAAGVDTDPQPDAA